MADKTVTVGSGRDYATIQAALDGEYSANPNLSTMDGILYIRSYNPSDTTAAVQPAFTVDSSHYVQIESAASARHAGVWSGSAASLSTTNGKALTITCSYTRVIGMQISVGANSDWGNDLEAISLAADTQGCVITDNILRCTMDQSFHTTTYGVHGPYGTVGGHKIYNNIVYGFKSLAGGLGCFGLRVLNGGTVNHIHSNTIADCYNGIYLQAYVDGYARNNLLYNCTAPFLVGTGSTFTTSHNATDSSSFGADYTNQTGDRVSQTFTFTDESGKDFTLSSSDAGALGYGTDLSGDTYCPFATDIVSNSRTSPWSIGASQPVSQGSTPANVGFWFLMCI